MSVGTRPCSAPEPTGKVPIIALRLTISRGKLALEDATAALAPNIMVMCGGTDSLPVLCINATTASACMGWPQDIQKN